MQIIKFFLNFIRVWMQLLKPGGVKSIVAENITLRNQLIVLARKQKRSPRLSAIDRILFGILGSMISVKRLLRIAIAIKPATILKFHKALVKKKYHLLFSNKNPKKSGQKGPPQTVINAVLEMKERNPNYGHRRIAMQIAIAFGCKIDKDVVRRILNKYNKNGPDNRGPSWLTFISHMKDSLWSIDLFRAESIHVKTHWVMLIMDQFTRRIIGFAVHAGDVNGIDLCCMFNEIIAKQPLPKYLSSDNDPLFKFHRWRANLGLVQF